jgi:hypothetical protein
MIVVVRSTTARGPSREAGSVLAWLASAGYLRLDEMYGPRTGGW